MSNTSVKMDLALSEEVNRKSCTSNGKEQKNGKKAKKKFTLHQKIGLVMLASADFMCFCSMSIMAPFYPKEASDKGMSETVAGFVFSFYALVIFLSSPIFGKVIPRIGVKACFTGGILVSGICNILFGTLQYVQDYTLFTTLSFVIRGAEALGSSSYSTASYVLVNNIFPDHAGAVRGILETFVGLGLSAGPAIGGLLFAVGGFQLPFYVIGILIIFIAPLNKWLIHENQFEKEEKSGSFRKILRINSVIVTAVIIVVISITWSFLDPTLEPHMRKYHLTPANIGLIFLLLSGTYGIFSPVSGWISDRMKNYWLLMVIGLFCNGICLLFLGPSSLATFIKGSIGWDIGALSMLGIFVALALLPTYNAVLDAAIYDGGFEDNLGTQGLVAGLWSSVYSLGEVIGPVSGGALLSNWGFPVTTTVMAIMNLVTAVFAFIFFSTQARTGKNNKIHPDDQDKEQIKSNRKSKIAIISEIMPKIPEVISRSNSITK